MNEVHLVIRENTQKVRLSVGMDAPISIKVDDRHGAIWPIYNGETTVTPTESEQVLHTNEHVLKRDIVVGPIPSNYGKIVWNGSYIRVE